MSYGRVEKMFTLCKQKVEWRNENIVLALQTSSARNIRQESISSHVGNCWGLHSLGYSLMVTLLRVLSRKGTYSYYVLMTGAPKRGDNRPIP